jgi:transcriptional regulator with XRE-family HTH domain
MSQEDVAAECEFDRTYPSMLERGRRSPTFWVIVQLARALRMQPVALFADAVARLREEEERPRIRTIVRQKNRQFLARIGSRAGGFAAGWLIT